MQKIEIKPVSSIPRAKWDSYVSAHSQGCVFHQEAFFRIYEVTPQHEPFFTCAVNTSGDIVAMLCAVRVAVGEAMSRWTSRSLMYAPPICDNSQEGVAGLKLLLEDHDKHMAKRVLFTEIRPSGKCGELGQALGQLGYEYFDYFNYVQDLSEGENAICSRAKKMLQKVRSSERRGAEIKHLELDEHNIASVYRVISQSYCRAQVPLSPIQLFDASRRFLSAGVMSLRSLEFLGETVAVAVGLSYKDKYFAWFNGTTRPRNLPATSAVLVWDEMRTALKDGLTSYDFGGAGWPNEDYGPRVFKSRFKGQLTNHGRYRKVHSRLKLNMARAGYQLLRGTLSPNVRPPLEPDGSSKVLGAK